MMLPAPGQQGHPPPPHPPPAAAPARTRRDLVAEYSARADMTPPSADGVLTPAVYKELLADYLAWAGHPADAAFILRILSDANAGGLLRTSTGPTLNLILLLSLCILRASI